MSEREIAVCRVSEINNGEMRQVDADGTPVVLATVDGGYHAVSAHCTHYGAPLVDGVLSGDRIVCPWHHACFDIRTGRLEEPPAIDGLETFEVKIAGDTI